MTPAIIIQRAKVLLLKADDLSNEAIAERLDINVRTAMLWVHKYRGRSENETLEDILHVSRGRGSKESISGEAKTWLMGIACQKSRDLGFAAETWTNSALTRYIREHAEGGAIAAWPPSRRAACSKSWPGATSSRSGSNIIASGAPRLRQQDA